MANGLVAEERANHDGCWLPVREVEARPRELELLVAMSLVNEVLVMHNQCTISGRQRTARRGRRTSIRNRNHPGNPRPSCRDGQDGEVSELLERNRYLRLEHQLKHRAELERSVVGDKTGIDRQGLLTPHWRCLRQRGPTSCGSRSFW